jgi:hypothetical protein
MPDFCNIIENQSITPLSPLTQLSLFEVSAAVAV